MPTNNTERYEINLEQGLPAFQIVTPFDQYWDDLVVNDDTLFSWGFAKVNLTAESPVDVAKIYPAVYCVDLLPTIVDEEDMNKIIGALGGKQAAEDFLCPNITNYTVLNEDEGLIAVIYINDGLEDYEMELVGLS